MEEVGKFKDLRLKLKEFKNPFGNMPGKFALSDAIYEGDDLKETKKHIDDFLDAANTSYQNIAALLADIGKGKTHTMLYLYYKEIPEKYPNLLGAYISIESCLTQTTDVKNGNYEVFSRIITQAVIGETGILKSMEIAKWPSENIENANNKWISILEENDKEIKHFGEQAKEIEQQLKNIENQLAESEDNAEIQELTEKQEGLQIDLQLFKKANSGTELSFGEACYSLSIFLDWLETEMGCKVILFLDEIERFFRFLDNEVTAKLVNGLKLFAQMTVNDTVALKLRSGETRNITLKQISLMGATTLAAFAELQKVDQSCASRFNRQIRIGNADFIDIKKIIMSRLNIETKGAYLELLNGIDKAYPFIDGTIKYITKIALGSIRSAMMICHDCYHQFLSPSAAGSRAILDYGDFISIKTVKYILPSNSIENTRIENDAVEYNNQIPGLGVLFKELVEGEHSTRLSDDEFQKIIEKHNLDKTVVQNAFQRKGLITSYLDVDGNTYINLLVARYYSGDILDQNARDILDLVGSFPNDQFSIADIEAKISEYFSENREKKEQVLRNLRTYLQLLDDSGKIFRVAEDRYSRINQIPSDTAIRQMKYVAQTLRNQKDRALREQNLMADYFKEWFLKVIPDSKWKNLPDSDIPSLYLLETKIKTPIDVEFSILIWLKSTFVPGGKGTYKGIEPEELKKVIEKLKTLSPKTLALFIVGAFDKKLINDNPQSEWNYLVDFLSQDVIRVEIPEDYTFLLENDGFLSGLKLLNRIFTIPIKFFEPLESTKYQNLKSHELYLGFGQFLKFIDSQTDSDKKKELIKIKNELLEELNVDPIGILSQDITNSIFNAIKPLPAKMTEKGVEYFKKVKDAPDNKLPISLEDATDQNYELVIDSLKKFHILTELEPERKTRNVSKILTYYINEFQFNMSPIENEIYNALSIDEAQDLVEIGKKILHKKIGNDARGQLSIKMQMSWAQSKMVKENRETIKNILEILYERLGESLISREPCELSNEGAKGTYIYKKEQSIIDDNYLKNYFENTSLLNLRSIRDEDLLELVDNELLEFFEAKEGRDKSLFDMELEIAQAILDDNYRYRKYKEIDTDLREKTNKLSNIFNSYKVSVEADEIEFEQSILQIKQFLDGDSTLLNEIEFEYKILIGNYFANTISSLVKIFKPESIEIENIECRDIPNIEKILEKSEVSLNNVVDLYLLEENELIKSSVDITNILKNYNEITLNYNELKKDYQTSYQKGTLKKRRESIDILSEIIQNIDSKVLEFNALIKGVLDSIRDYASVDIALDLFSELEYKEIIKEISNKSEYSKFFKNISIFQLFQLKKEIKSALNLEDSLSCLNLESITIVKILNTETFLDWLINIQNGLSYTTFVILIGKYFFNEDYVEFMNRAFTNVLNSFTSEGKSENIKKRKEALENLIADLKSADIKNLDDIPKKISKIDDYYVEFKRLYINDVVLPEQVIEIYKKIKEGLSLRQISNEFDDLLAKIIILQDQGILKISLENIEDGNGA